MNACAWKSVCGVCSMNACALRLEAHVCACTHMLFSQKSKAYLMTTDLHKMTVHFLFPCAPLSPFHLLCLLLKVLRHHHRGLHYGANLTQVLTCLKRKGNDERCPTYTHSRTHHPPTANILSSAPLTFRNTRLRAYAGLPCMANSFCLAPCMHCSISKNRMIGAMVGVNEANGQGFCCEKHARRYHIRLTCGRSFPHHHRLRTRARQQGGGSQGCQRALSRQSPRPRTLVRQRLRLSPPSSRCVHGSRPQSSAAAPLPRTLTPPPPPSPRTPPRLHPPPPKGANVHALQEDLDANWGG